MDTIAIVDWRVVAVVGWSSLRERESIVCVSGVSVCVLFFSNAHSYKICIFIYYLIRGMKYITIHIIYLVCFTWELQGYTFRMSFVMRLYGSMRGTSSVRVPVPGPPRKYLVAHREYFH